jgi:hypothetical protein
LQLVVAALAAATAASAVVSLLPTSAGAHGGSSKFYRSEVTGIEPASLPIAANVLYGDDQIRIENTGDGVLIVEGYEDDQYVRIAPGDGVEVNHNATAFYLNQERYGTDVPDGAGGDAKPDFRRIRETPLEYEFHDHRIHWMLKSLPPNVDADDPSEQKVNDWEIPVTYDGKPGTIQGKLTYIGGGKDDGNLVLWATIAGIALVVVAFAVDARRRRRQRGAADAPVG